MQAVRPPQFGEGWKWWLPPYYSSYGDEVDTLYWWIFWITSITFVLVEGALLYFCFKYKRDPARKAVYTHGNHKLEVWWTVIPAVILVALGVFSSATWAKIKNPADPNHPKEFQTTLLVTAQQFQWNVTYPGTDGAFGTDDDFTRGNELVVPYEPKDESGAVITEENVRVMLTAKDVIHSFFCPVLRLKQDAVPGYVGNIWFDVDRPTHPGPDGIHLTNDEKLAEDGRTRIDWEESYEVACAELCGLGHSQMRMLLKAVPRADYERWVAKLSEEAKKLAAEGNK